MANITLTEKNNRLYIQGNTFHIKEQIKGAGGRWDGEEKAWWVEPAQKEAVENLLGTLPEAPARIQEEYHGPVTGKVEYKGRGYYIRGEENGRIQLVSLDGKLNFWAPESACSKRRDYQTKGDKPQTLANIREFIDKKREEGPKPADTAE